MFKRLALSAAIVLASSGAAFADPISDFNAFLAQATTMTQADLQAAEADATAHNDQAAMQCYSGVEAYIVANPVTLPAIAAPVGVVSSFQLARDGVKLAEANQGVPKVPDAINQACGYLALDVQKDVVVVSTGLTILGVKLF